MSLVQRPPAWSLVADDGNTGWHLIAGTTPDRRVVTVCGVTGRLIADNARSIQMCLVCEAGVEPV